tara:strand:+ start:2966 stop:3814 length:849 start_codon:yes stop_codon:yes gene_type:complete
MQKIKIDGQRYNIPTAYSECNVLTAKKALLVWDVQDKEFKELIQENPEEIEEGVWINFLINWVVAVTGAKEDIVKRIHFVDLNVIWNSTQFILSTPDQFLTIDKLRGVSITDSIKTLSGVEIIGGEASYEQWSLMNQLTVLMNEAKESRRLDLLKKMLSVIYPVKDESKEDLNKRLKDYDTLSLLQLYSGWFFFCGVVKWVASSYPTLKEQPNSGAVKGSNKSKPKQNAVVKKYREVNIWEIYAHNLAKANVLAVGFDEIMKLPMMKVLKHIEIEKSFEHEY